MLHPSESPKRKKSFTRKPAMTSASVRKDIQEVVRLSAVPTDLTEAKKLTRSSTYQDVYEAIPDYLIRSNQFHPYHRLYILPIEKYRTKAIADFTADDRWAFKNDLKALYLQSREEPSPSTYAKIENEIDKVFRFAMRFAMVHATLPFALGSRASREFEKDDDIDIGKLFPGLAAPVEEAPPSVTNEWAPPVPVAKTRTEDECEEIRERLSIGDLVWFHKGGYARRIAGFQLDSKQRKARVFFQGTKRSVKISTLYQRTYSLVAVVPVDLIRS